MSADEAPLVAALARQTFRETFFHYDDSALAAFLDARYGAPAFATEMAAGDTEFWLAGLAGEAVGYAQWGRCKLPVAPVYAGAFELHRLYVAKRYHGLGLGRIFMERAFAAARGQGARAMVLGVWEKNEKAQRFYARYGFTKIGEYDYPPIGEVVDREWILAKELGEES